MKLVDASSWIEFLRGRTSEPSLRVRSLLARGQAAWCDLTLVELWNGARGKTEKQVLEALESEVRLYPLTEQAWANACELARRCRSKGLTVPSADIVIAACAAAHKLELEHCDGHFDDILPLAKAL
jgi:predicted nucleic acid-binding protein